MQPETMRVMTSSASEEHGTPDDFYNHLAKYFGPFDLDPAATAENARAPRFFTKEDDGLAQPWSGRVFVNPPYGRGITGKWVEKAATEAKNNPKVDHVVMLLPARTDTKWFHDWVLPYARTIFFVSGRLTFKGSENSAPFPSIVVIFTKSSYQTPDFGTLWGWKG